MGSGNTAGKRSGSALRENLREKRSSLASERTFVPCSAMRAGEIYNPLEKQWLLSILFSAREKLVIRVSLWMN